MDDACSTGRVNRAAAKNFFLDLSWDYSGPIFLCRYIDPTWDIAHIQKTLAPVPAASTP